MKTTAASKRKPHDSKIHIKPAKSGSTSKNGGMEHPLWILVPWAVFALGMGLKVWRIYWAVRRSVAPAMGIEQFRQSLESSWAKNHQAA